MSSGHFFPCLSSSEATDPICISSSPSLRPSLFSFQIPILLSSSNRRRRRRRQHQRLSHRRRLSERLRGQGVALVSSEREKGEGRRRGEVGEFDLHAGASMHMRIWTKGFARGGRVSTRPRRDMQIANHPYLAGKRAGGPAGERCERKREGERSSLRNVERRSKALFTIDARPLKRRAEGEGEKG